jgi:voltage-gated potassium channel
MTRVTALVLRRMRVPLLVLITAYALSMLGLVLVPGVDEAGGSWRMSFFDAFYFVSYTATTIGFGEIPQAFSPAQRLWTTVSLYLTVVAWFYALGNILALVQDPAFRQALTESRYARSVRRLREPFYLVCGYGDTGSLLVRALTERRLRAVVIDINPDRINALKLEDLSVFVPGLAADASVPEHLVAGGLQHPRCTGVVALTDRDDANLQVAITSKLLNPALEVICRAETHDAAATMASFGTQHIVNPFDAFAGRLATALHSPDMHVLYEWLTDVPDRPCRPVIYPPRGTWVLCGYGRFGKAVRRYLDYEGLKSVVVEAHPEEMDCTDCITGRGTEAVTLREARIDRAVGIVAGTADDANNLSILMTARDLNPHLFFVARQNRRANDAIFKAARADLIMQRSEIVAREVLARITTPLLSRFLRLARHQKNVWARDLVERLGAIVGAVVPHIWTLEMQPASAPGLTAALAEGVDLRLVHLSQDSRDRSRHLSCLALFLAREGEDQLLPGDETQLRSGDAILFCGRREAQSGMAWVTGNLNAISYVVSGNDRPAGYVWRLFSRRPG